MVNWLEFDRTRWLRRRMAEAPEASGLKSPVVVRTGSVRLQPPRRPGRRSGYRCASDETNTVTFPFQIQIYTGMLILLMNFIAVKSELVQ